MYKWKDEKGVTHFSETPPPDGKDAAKIEVKTTKADKPAVDNWREREQMSKQDRAKKGIADEQARKQEESQAAQRCRAAQRTADTMRNSGRVFQLNEKGERVWLDDKQRSAELAEAQQDIARYCR